MVKPVVVRIFRDPVTHKVTASVEVAGQKPYMGTIIEEGKALRTKEPVILCGVINEISSLPIVIP